MPVRPSRSTPEPRYKTGEVRLTHNHLALLLGLLDRPYCTAASINDWLDAAMPHAARFTHYPSTRFLRSAKKSLHSDWVSLNRRGSCIEVALTPRGRAIAERQVPARIVGRGPYTALPPRSAILPPVRPKQAPPALQPSALQLSALQPSTLPSFDVPGVDMGFRPDDYPRDFTEIARITFALDSPSVLSFCAQRVGRSFRLCAESFPHAEWRSHRRVAPAVLTFAEMVELIDQVEYPGMDRSERRNITLLDVLAALWRRSPLSPQVAIERLGALRVESAIYPELQAYYAERVRRWVQVLHGELTRTGAADVTDGR